MMECRDYVDLALGGSGNVEILQREVSSGRIKQTQLKMMALQMHEEVHGVFVEKRSHPQGLPLLDILNFMLDKWYITVLQDLPAGQGLRELKRVLEEPGIGAAYLAARLK